MKILTLLLYTPHTFRFLGFYPQVFSEFPDELPVEVRVAVLGQLVQNKPVSDLSLSQHILETPGSFIIVFTTDL